MIEAAIARLKDSEKCVRSAAAKALAAIAVEGDRHTLDSLMACIHDLDWNVRMESVRSLVAVVGLEREYVTDLMIRKTAHSNVFVRRAAFWAIAEIAPEVRVRRLAVVTLGEMTDDQEYQSQSIFDSFWQMPGTIPLSPEMLEEFSACSKAHARYSARRRCVEFALAKAALRVQDSDSVTSEKERTEEFARCAADARETRLQRLVVNGPGICIGSVAQIPGGQPPDARWCNNHS